MKKILLILSLILSITLLQQASAKYYHDWHGGTHKGYHSHPSHGYHYGRHSYPHHNWYYDYDDDDYSWPWYLW